MGRKDELGRKSGIYRNRDTQNKKAGRDVLSEKSYLKSGLNGIIHLKKLGRPLPNSNLLECNQNKTFTPYRHSGESRNPGGKGIV